MADLTRNIPRVCKDLQGGVKTVYLFPYVKYNRTEILFTEQVVTTFPSTNIYSTHSTSTNYSENTEIEGGDVAFSQSFSLQFPKTEATNQLHRLVTQRWRAIFLDENGKFRILGLWNGLEATFNNETGGDKASMNGYKINFTGKEDNQAYFLNDLSIVTFDFTTNLVASWQFEQNLLDYTGNHNGTAVGSVDTNDINGGRVAFGAQFLGSTDYVTVADSTDFEMTDGNDLPFSISFWTKFNVFRTPAEGEFLINKKGGTTDEWNIKHQDSILNLSLYDGANDIKITYTPSWIIDTWYHVVVTYTGSETKEGLIMYVNNVSVGTQAETGTYTGMTAGTSDVVMGTDGGTPATGELIGILDEVKVYKNRILTPIEIAEIYTKELTGTSVL